ncbi:structural protein [Microbulbifer sp. SAOS-129_SWC]|uniref:structural protein n=1 Tax=Microbulbifer sp. SAOS-129_SWC TaxID=3145235 RepID=UPI003216457C
MRTAVAALVTLAAGAALLFSTRARAATPEPNISQDEIDMTEDTRPRGIRNNNPGNIEAGEPWQGATGDDGRYLVFESPLYGLRALSRTLDTYRSKYGINTVAGIIDRWAPDIENNTAAYIAHVASAVGVAPQEQLQPVHRLPLIAAIVLHENGQQPYSDALIAQAIELARA